MSGDANDAAKPDVRQFAATDQLVYVVRVDAQQLGGFSDRHQRALLSRRHDAPPGGNARTQWSGASTVS